MTHPLPPFRPSVNQNVHMYGLTPFTSVNQNVHMYGLTPFTVLAEKDVQIQPDGRKLRVYEHKLTGEAFVVTDPELQLSQLEAVQDEVVAILGWHSNATPPPAPAPAGEAPPAPPSDQPQELGLDKA